MATSNPGLVRGSSAAGLLCVGYALIWGVLTEWSAASWVVGTPVVCAAAWLSVVLRPGGDASVSPAGLLRLIPFFVWQSIRGGVDVALRALRGPAAIDPLVCHVAATLPSTGARVLAAIVISLLPGTLAVDVQGDHYEIHALNGPAETVARDVRLVESRVALVFGLRAPKDAAS